MGGTGQPYNQIVTITLQGGQKRTLDFALNYSVDAIYENNPTERLSQLIPTELNCVVTPCLLVDNRPVYDSQAALRNLMGLSVQNKNDLCKTIDNFFTEASEIIRKHKNKVELKSTQGITRGEQVVNNDGWKKKAKGKRAR